jgi:hypothetical protein
MLTFQRTRSVPRYQRRRFPDLTLCALEQRLSLSAATAQPAAVIPPVPTLVQVPVGTGHCIWPLYNTDRANWPAGDGHNLPGFETDPGDLPPSNEQGLIMGDPMDPANPGPTQPPTMPSPMEPNAMLLG